MVFVHVYNPEMLEPKQRKKRKKAYKKKNKNYYKKLLQSKE